MIIMFESLEPMFKLLERLGRMMCVCVPDKFILLNCQKFSVVIHNPKAIFAKSVKQWFSAQVGIGDDIGYVRLVINSAGFGNQSKGL